MDTVLNIAAIIVALMILVMLISLQWPNVPVIAAEFVYTKYKLIESRIKKHE